MLCHLFFATNEWVYMRVNEEGYSPSAGQSGPSITALPETSRTNLGKSCLVDWVTLEQSARTFTRITNAHLEPSTVALFLASRLTGNRYVSGEAS